MVKDPQMVQRRDTVALMSSRMTMEGYLEAPARVAKVGVLTYYDDQGKAFKEFVPAETLFDEDSTKGLVALPVTNRHPLNKVDAQNATQLMKGFTLGPSVREKDGEDDLLGCTVKIMDGQLLGDVQIGMQELSLGYDALLDFTPGVYKGESYDAVQKKRIYNHLAVVPAARAGHKARLRLDSARNLIVEEEMALVKIKLDGKEVEVEQSVADALTKVQAAGQEALAQLKDAKKDLETKSGELDTLKKSQDAAGSEQAKKDAEQAKKDAVKARVALLEQAKTIIPKADQVKLDDMDDQAIMVACLTVHDSEFKADGLSADYIKGAFSAALKAPAKKADGSSIGALIVHGNKDGKEAGSETVLTLDQVTEKKRQSLGDAWKKPLMAKAA